VNWADFGREKNYDLYPQLLDFHVQRMVEAHRRVLTYMQDTELLHGGMLRFEGFLGSGAAEEIKEQALKIAVSDGISEESRVATLPTGAASDGMIKVLSVLEGVFHKNLQWEMMQHLVHGSYLQHLFNSPDDGDPQKVFHSDTFFPCVKFWYFPQAVGKNDGPLLYVAKSAELTHDLIQWHRDRVEDLKAGKAEDWRGVGHKEGSFRINEQELSDLGYKPEAVTVEPDTLIVANVFGFHRRGDTEEPTHRVSMHGSIRITNPFVW
jgi:hypothetical protein